MSEKKQEFALGDDILAKYVNRTLPNVLAKSEEIFQLLNEHHVDMGNGINVIPFMR